MSPILGVLLVLLAGLGTGTCAWPFKVMRKFSFEQCWFCAMLVGLIIIPWAVTILFCPHAFEAYAKVPIKTILISNLCALSWGVANLLAGLCITRIGVALSGAILGGLGISVGVTVPMLVKGSGLFRNAPDIGSTAGIISTAGVAAAVTGVVMVAIAGLGRERAMKKDEKKTSGAFTSGLIMAVIAGLSASGISFSFVYSQGPIVAAMKAKGAGDLPANMAVWAVGLMGGALLNVIYPACIMTKKRSWGLLREHPGEILLTSVIGIQLILAVNLMGRGMLYLGALGGSIGFGIQQVTQLMGNQGVGFISGEWKGVYGRPRRLMYLSLLVLIAAVVVMAYANSLAHI